MRSRTIREGSVGLLILVGLGVFVGLVVWLRGLSLANRSYKFIVNFANVAGMRVGASVRYRGVSVGKIAEVQARTNGVDATVEITPANLLIPRDVVIEANQAGLVGETSIDIRPLKSLPKDALSLNPLSSTCDSKRIICNKARLNGQIGVSFDELLRSTIRFSNAYSNPAFFDSVNRLTQNASIAATGAAQLTSELSLLSRSLRREVGNFSTSANSLTSTTNQTVTELGRSANRSLNQVGLAASRFGNTADQYSLTAAQLNKLVASANELVVTNRGGLVKTLNSVTQTSDQLRVVLSNLTPALAQINSTVGNLNSASGKLNTAAGEVKVGTLLRNLETLSANAAQASANLRDITTTLNNPSNVVVLQQTLDSARATFENAQKITSDLDELTGDPAFRNNLKQLVNGLGNLVSSTQQLEQQVQVAKTLEPVSAALNTTVSSVPPSPVTNQQSQPNAEQVTPSTPLHTHNESLLMPPAPKKPLPGKNSQLAADGEREKR
ncbi:MAG TPA: MCE family protein [Cyanobacteria bacterium UBA8553]|nr:MCE family protein [Cyanobacteria bacterium UBA8553]HAJ63768.1 MCE family protein [Cyanobacteria bacterium UBA8543]